MYFLLNITAKHARQKNSKWFEPGSVGSSFSLGQFDEKFLNWLAEVAHKPFNIGYCCCIGQFSFEC